MVLSTQIIGELLACTCVISWGVRLESKDMNMHKLLSIHSIYACICTKLTLLFLSCHFDISYVSHFIPKSLPIWVFFSIMYRTFLTNVEGLSHFLVLRQKQTFIFGKAKGKVVFEI